MANSEHEMRQTVERHNGLGPNEVGFQLRIIRRARGRTLKYTAQAAQITESYLSQIERGIANPSLSTLARVADVFGLGIRDLFNDATDDDPRLLRKEERPILHFDPHGRKLHLTPSIHRRLDAFTWEFEPGGATGSEPYTHGDSEEFLLLLSGGVTIELDGKRFEMRAGDSIVYLSSIPHLVFESEGARAEALWVMTPPSL